MDLLCMTHNQLGSRSLRLYYQLNKDIVQRRQEEYGNIDKGHLCMKHMELEYQDRNHLG